MATTTNYGWTTPDDTALVKDGAAAIRTLGSSVDTTTKALNPSTTLGDIEYRSSTANTNTRLGIGSTGDVLTVSGGVPAWAAPAAGGLTLINAGGTTLTGASISISSIPTTYNNLYVVIRDYVTNADNDGLLVRFNSDTGSNYAQRSAFANGAALTWNATRWNVSEGNDNSVANGLVILEIFDYANTATNKMANYYSLTTDGTDTANYRYAAGGGFYKSPTTAITSITLLPEALGTFSGGTVFVYGVK
jgi:hypothetical protein